MKSLEGMQLVYYHNKPGNEDEKKKNGKTEPENKQLNKLFKKTIRHYIRKLSTENIKTIIERKQKYQGSK